MPPKRDLSPASDAAEEAERKKLRKEDEQSAGVEEEDVDDELEEYDEEAEDDGDDVPSDAEDDQDNESASAASSLSSLEDLEGWVYLELSISDEGGWTIPEGREREVKQLNVKFDCDMNYEDGSTTEFGFDYPRLFGFGNSMLGVDRLFPNLTALRVQLDFASDDVSQLAFENSAGLRHHHVSFQFQTIIDRCFDELFWRRPVELRMVLTDSTTEDITDDGTDISSYDTVLKGNTIVERLGESFVLGMMEDKTDEENAEDAEAGEDQG